MRTIPLNDTGRVFIENQATLTQALLEIAASGRWLLGARTDAFAKAFAKFCGAQFCTPVGNGTDALELALRSVINPKEVTEVITVANAGGYATTACRLVGAIPVYVDIDPATLLLDLNLVEAALRPTTQAIVVTHLYGAVVDVLQLKRILVGHGYGHLVIIEDCAQAHGAMLPGGQRVGTMGDMATYSFYPTKNLPAMGDGGAILTSSPERYEALKQLHQYGWKGKYEVVRAGGRNSRLHEMQAAVLLTLLPLLEEMNERRRKILARYNERGGSDLTWCRHDKIGSVAHLVVARVKRRDEFRRFLAARGVATDVHYPILDCDQPGWRDLPMRLVGDLSNSRGAVLEIVTLPCFPHLTREELEYVCDVLGEWSVYANPQG